MVIKMDKLELLNESASYIKERLSFAPSIGLILGSGLGELGDEIENAVTIPYGEIPHFPVSTVEGHAGNLVVGTLCGKTVVAMQGRFHYYEGYTMEQVAYPVRVMRLLGVKTLLLTNAAGGINRMFQGGNLMLICDHIKFFSDGPLRGPNLDAFGPRFNDMSQVYTKRLRELATACAKECGVALREGVYAFMPGPCYETPAEIRMLSCLGADAVGMSTVPEATVAAHGGMEVLGLSCITNMAAGILDQPLCHEEVIETARRVKDGFKRLMRLIIERI